MNKCDYIIIWWSSCFFSKKTKKQFCILWNRAVLIRSIGTIGLLAFLPLLLLGQQIATNEALDKACSCFNSVDFSSITLEQGSLVADSCISEALYTNLTGVLKENNATLENADALFKVAQIFHSHLLKNCKGFQQFSKRVAKNRVREIKQKNNSNIGLLYQLNTNQQFPVFTILTENNKALEFIWFREFDGSTRFMNGLKDYQNTVVEIVWKDVELYDVMTQSYPFYKEIILIEELKKIDKKTRKSWIKNYQQTLKKEDKKRRK